MTTDARVSAAIAGIRRLSGLDQGLIEVVLDETPQGADRFDVSVQEGRLRVRATTPAVALAGYAQAARRGGFADVSRSGVRAASDIEGVTCAVRAESPYPWRVAYNITVAGYTTPFFGWAEWERELDILAASGVNAAHITLGQEAVWLHAFQEFGYDEEEILAWIVPPSHQPWQWLNNVQSLGGGTTRGIVQRRVALARRVIARMRELEIVPILPGFSGSVPPGFAERHPGAQTVDQGLWFMDVSGAHRPDWLRSDTPEYGRVAEAFYRIQRDLFGEGGWWAVDLLHEGGKTGGASLPAAARGVENAMRAADADYRWVIQAWAGNPRQELLDALDAERLLVLDLTGESWEGMSAYGKAPWVLGILPNYGGRTGLYGDLRAIAALPAILSDPRRGALSGITDMAEGVANNPVVWDLFHDLVWTREVLDLDDWFGLWLRARYGRVSDGALEAWRVLRAHAYGPWRTDGTADAPKEVVLTAMGRPVDAATVGDIDLGPSPFAIPMDQDGVEEALALFTFYAGTDSVVAALPSLAANQASAVGPRRRRSASAGRRGTPSIGCGPRCLRGPRQGCVRHGGRTLHRCD
jgi:hypothetical protein